MLSSHLYTCCWWSDIQVVLWFSDRWRAALHSCLAEISGQEKIFTSSFWAGNNIRSSSLNADADTCHVRKCEYVNNKTVAATLQAADSHGGSGIWHYELCSKVWIVEEWQQSSIGTSWDFILSQWHNHQHCLQTQHGRQDSTVIIIVGDEDQ